MKKFGFTLAEVLITLGIIGVVAALTAPALVMQSRDQANAAKLAVTVSNLENAFTTAISSENAPDLYRTSIWTQGITNAFNRNAFVGNLKRYINVSDWRNMTVANYYTQNNAGGMHRMNANGSVNQAVAALPNGNSWFDDNWNLIIETKQGATIIIRPYVNRMSDGVLEGLFNPTQQMINHGGGLYERAANIVIDVNGLAAPNVWGRDIFFFMLGADGRLFPVGGLDSSVYISRVENTWENSNSEWLQCRDEHFLDGRGCAGRVVSNGYRIDY